MHRGNLYKLLNQNDAHAADLVGTSHTALDLEDGYVHLSDRDQVADTAARHYHGQEGIVLLEFDPEIICGDIRWEKSRGGALFPHLYGDLHIGLATRRWVLELNAEGIPQIPDDL